MTDQNDIDGLAAEYVLGTLDAAERVAVAARRNREPALDAAIAGWEKRLAPFDALTPPLQPPEGLYEKIEEWLDGGRLGAGSSNIVSLEQRVAAWRRAAIAASAIAASLLVTIGVREATRPIAQQSRYVAVFNKDDVSPSFLLTVDLERKELSIKPIGVKPEPGKTFELWILPEGEKKPSSLGLLAAGDVTVKPVGVKIEPEMLLRATFGVSQEPAGGSPTGQPTSPALHAKFVSTGS